MQLHETIHLGMNKIKVLISPKFYVPDLPKELQNITGCHACWMTSPTLKKTQAKRERGTATGVFWEMNFTEVKTGNFGFKYLLVFIDTVSG